MVLSAHKLELPFRLFEKLYQMLTLALLFEGQGTSWNICDSVEFFSHNIGKRADDSSY